MGARSSAARPPRDAQPIFYAETVQTISEPPVPEPVPPPPPPAPVVDIAELKATERARVLAEMREQETSEAEAAAARIGRWAAEQRSRVAPCAAEQAEVERCYASPPEGDHLRCSDVVMAFARCAKV
eukprot:TRINITY_DN51770_c0_g1_i1.p2 TRINITY_DN51770_c0_g1~~TRINITY_DN51770_c0_g1_i1.p2  ORF type:complete len:127 (+),score=31.85 TRINITY_DN51770_c0_g1_i1:125-505(+)